MFIRAFLILAGFLALSVSPSWAAELSRGNVNSNSTEKANPMKTSHFCLTFGDGDFPQFNNCYRYLSCSNIYEFERECPSCLQEDAPPGKLCCGGRTCWHQTKRNEGVCEWCSDCDCTGKNGAAMWENQ